MKEELVALYREYEKDVKEHNSGKCDHTPTLAGFIHWLDYGWVSCDTYE